MTAPTTDRLHITLPQALRARLEAEAVRAERSVSWVVTQALERYLARQEGGR